MAILRKPRATNSHAIAAHTARGKSFAGLPRTEAPPAFQRSPRPGETLGAIAAEIRMTMHPPGHELVAPMRRMTLQEHVVHVCREAPVHIGGGCRGSRDSD